MRKVLFLSSIFPPEAASGARRVTKLAKYLPRFGWEPRVLHVPVRGTRYANDPTLQSDVRADLLGATVPPVPWQHAYSLTSRLFGWPGLGEEWPQYRCALHAGVLIALQQDVEAIFVTAPPKRLPTLGLWIAQATGLPLVTDFRDPPWPLEARWRPRARSRRYFEQQIRDVFAGSAALVVNTEPVAEVLAEHRDVTPSRISVIPNGYDEDDFAALPRPPAPPPEGRPLVVVLAGSVLPGEKVPLLVAALDAIAEEPAVHRNLRIRFLGRQRPEVRSALERCASADCFDFPGHVSHASAIQALASADVNLVLLNDRHSRLRVPQKVYPCLRAGRPILGVMGYGPARRLLDESGLALTCSPQEPRAITGALLAMLRCAPTGGFPKSPSLSGLALERFEYAGLAKQLAGVFDAVAAEPAGAR